MTPVPVHRERIARVSAVLARACIAAAGVALAATTVRVVLVLAQHAGN